MTKFKILFGTNYRANDTTSFLRAYGPFTLMSEYVEIVEPKLTYRKKNPNEPGDEAMDLDLRAGWWNDWRSWRGVDVCFLHRPYGLLGGSIINAAKMHGVPVWVDHDDDLLEIPDKNPHQKLHLDGEKLFPGVEYSYKEADILTCSGKVMHKKLVEKYGRKDAILITTGLDDELVRLKKPFNKNNKISWRGSTSHVSDLEHFKIPIMNVAKKHPEIYWCWLGIDVRQIFDGDIFEGEFSPQRSMMPFLNELCGFNSSIHIVPLEDNVFNRVKSNLSWLDATLAGSAVLGPAFEEWDKPGITQYKDDFEGWLEVMLGSNGRCLELEARHNESWKYIKKNLLTSKLNYMRFDILKRLGYRHV